jgi:hypothetical protein
MFKKSMPLQERLLPQNIDAERVVIEISLWKY